MMDIVDVLKNGKGFIAALDQSGGSSIAPLINYGYDEAFLKNNDALELIHQMRTRIITNNTFNNNYLIGVILFKDTIEKGINGEDTIKYLLNKKILPFVKIDIGLEDLESGSALMKDIPNLEPTLDYYKTKGIIGTKMRSVIKEYNEYAIKKVIEQQFKYAKIIIKKGLVPIIEPEVDINAPNKKNIEVFMKKEIMLQLHKMHNDEYCMFKFSLPEIPGTYDELAKVKNVLRICALSGGYSKEISIEKLKDNKKMIASFSRTLLEGLSINQSDEEFNYKLKENIEEIYAASTKKNK